MDVTPLVKEGAQIIQSYAGGVFKVSGESYTNPIIVTSEVTQQWNTKRSDLLNFEADDFAQIIGLSQSFDIFLCGTGQSIKFLSSDLKNTLKEQGVSLDVMDTGAACRTYNVLMAEGRRVCAVLLPV